MMTSMLKMVMMIHDGMMTTMTMEVNDDDSNDECGDDDGSDDDSNDDGDNVNDNGNDYKGLRIKAV